MMLESTGLTSTGQLKSNNRNLAQGTEPGQYDYGARFYDPVIGRWTTVDMLAEDPTQIDLSPYAYVGNNPILKDDPDGNCPLCEMAIAGLVGGIVG
jgi:RHS repeat-associated protein